MERLLLLGNEAIGLGALHAGLSGIYGYPGTPSTEIFEFVQSQAKTFNVRAIWSANEKVGFEEALGTSFAGKRAMVTMKHVGLNVAADPFMNSAMTGVNGGLVLAVADDPGMHSSQNEQDSRYYADFARIPCFEPSSQQEAYDMMVDIFDLSENEDVPVMLRTVTRLSHSRADIIASNSPRDQNPLKPSNDWRKWVLLPVNARKKNIELIKKQERLTKLSENSKYNDLKINPDARLGIIVSGITYNYLMENINDLNEPVNILKICQYPIPFKLVNELVKNSEDILVIEEGYPFIESKMQGMFGVPGTIVRGRMSGDLPRTGEMNSDFVREALGLETQSHQGIDQSTIPNRPPMLCKGCPHADTFKALAEAVNDIPSAKIYSDIGCYTLGVLPPYNCGESCVDMGASLSMAFGSSGMGVHPAIAIIGDSTFIHSGMTPLIGAAKENADVNVFIMDNALVAMTGAQETMASGQKLIDIVAELGVDRNHIVTFNPLPKNHDENVKLIQKELEYEGTSVIIPQRPCIHSKKR